MAENGAAKIRSAYSPRISVPARDSGPSRAKQSFRKECDINEVMAKYRAHGVVGHVSTREAVWGADLPASGDFHEAMNFVKEVESVFETLPAELRKRFKNDAGLYLDFVSDDENVDEARKLGLIPPERPVQVDPASEAVQEGETPEDLA